MTPLPGPARTYPEVFREFLNQEILAQGVVVPGKAVR